MRKFFLIPQQPPWPQYSMHSDTRPPPLKRSLWWYGKWRVIQHGSRRLNYICDSGGIIHTLTWKAISALTSTALFLPPYDHFIAALCMMLLLLHVWQLPVSAQMMDSAQMPHSFLLNQYKNPLWSSASWSCETMLIYESISGASGQSRWVCLNLYLPTDHPTSQKQD